VFCKKAGGPYDSRGETRIRKEVWLTNRKQGVQVEQDCSTRYRDSISVENTEPRWMRQQTCHENYEDFTFGRKQSPYCYNLLRIKKSWVRLVAC